MSLWATGRCVRAQQYARLHRLGKLDSISGTWTRSLTTTPALQINVQKGANRPSNKPHRKRDIAKLKAARDEANWDDEDYSSLEESVGGPEAVDDADGPRITKVTMKKPGRLPYSQWTTPREGKDPDEQAPPGDLPLPPFMRTQKKSTRFDKWYKTGTYDFDRYDTQKEKESKAPFATAFAQNPWAQMLATPLRQDSFTGARLPKACLLDFHLADDAESEKTKLLPLGLAAALLPKGQRWSQEQRELKETDKRESKVVPEGVATYVLAKKEALEHVDSNPSKWMRKRVVGLRMATVLERDRIGGNLEWHAGMAEVVLKSLRKIVGRRLREMLQFKEVPDNEGVIAALPNRYGLQALDDVENVGCVVRLKPLGPDDPPEPKRIPEPKTPERSHYWPNTTSFLGDSYGEWDEESPAQRWAREDATRVERGEPPQEEQSQRSDTQKLMLDHWSHADKRGSPFLGHCLPLPPPANHMTWYYPTIRYRSQRVPIYNLPHLLGDYEMKRLLDGTAFGDVKVVTVTQPWASAQLQIWLFKLQMFLARTKEETEKV